MSSLDNLRKAAKRWLKELHAGEPTAVARLQAVLPQAFPSPGLRDIQRALALERGFESWTALKKKLANGARDGVSDEARLHALIEAASKGDVGRVIEIADASRKSSAVVVNSRVITGFAPSEAPRLIRGSRSSTRHQSGGPRSEARHAWPRE